MGYAVYFVLTLKWGFSRRSKISTVQMIYHMALQRVIYIYLYIYIIISDSRVWSGRGGEQIVVARYDKWVTKLGEKKVYKNKWTTLKQLVYLQIKMINGQAKRLSNVHKIATRNEVMSEMPERATQEKQPSADQSRTLVANIAILSSRVFLTMRETHTLYIYIYVYVDTCTHTDR